MMIEMIEMMVMTEMVAMPMLVYCCHSKLSKCDDQNYDDDDDNAF